MAQKKNPVSKKMSEAAVNALHDALLPVLPGSETPFDFVSQSALLGTIQRSDVGPNSGGRILEEIPELAEYYTVEALDDILDDLWWHPDIQERDVDMLCLANPVVGVEDLEPILTGLVGPDEISKYEPRGSLGVRMFLRHNPNASLLAERRGPVDFVISKFIGLDMAVRLSPDLLIQILEGHGDPDEAGSENYQYAIVGKMRWPLEKWVEFFFETNRVKDQKARSLALKWIAQKRVLADIEMDSLSYFLGVMNDAVLGEHVDFFEILAGSLVMLRSLESFLRIAPKTYAMDRLF